MELNSQNNPLTNKQAGHETSDVDSSKFAQHHTLGLAANQASSGNHSHNGVDSRLISQFSDSNLVTQWTPVLQGSTTNPVLNNGTVKGVYLRLGQICLFSIEWISGSTTTYGSGAYSFTIPFRCYPNTKWPVAGLLKNGTFKWPMNGWVLDDVLYNFAPASGRTEGISTSSITQTGWKTAWASGDSMNFSGMYLIDLALSPI